MKILKIKLSLLAFLFNFFIFNIAAQEEIEEDVQEEADVSYFIKYLENMKSFALDFTQVDSKGNHATGTLLINKPNFRCNYYPPYPLLIVGNENNLSMYDYDMDTLARVKASDNLFSFLLMNHVNLSQHFNFEIIDETDRSIKINLIHLDSDKNTEIVIDKKSNQLKELKIFEKNNTITVSFNNLRMVKSFNADLFVMHTPIQGSTPERLTRRQLESQFK